MKTFLIFGVCLILLCGFVSAFYYEQDFSTCPTLAHRSAASCACTANNELRCSTTRNNYNASCFDIGYDINGSETFNVSFDFKIDDVASYPVIMAGISNYSNNAPESDHVYSYKSITLNELYADDSDVYIGDFSSSKTSIGKLYNATVNTTLWFKVDFSHTQGSNYMQFRSLKSNGVLVGIWNTSTTNMNNHIYRYFCVGSDFSDSDAGSYSNVRIDNLTISTNGDYATQPQIILINFTSDGGQVCGNGTTCGPTTDTTPTFKITTNVNALCRISDAYDNYTVMGSDRDCMPNTGNTSLTCTLNADDALVLGGVDDVYIACKHAEYSSYTISNISINLEEDPGGSFSSNATQAIVDGIVASSIPSATKYYDQQVYVRYANGSEKSGTYDVVASYGNQRWLFNYLLNQTDATGMSSISTALNIWENISLTYDQIVNQVTSLIDSTKN